jgi:hypothetical protein
LLRFYFAFSFSQKLLVIIWIEITPKRLLKLYNNEIYIIENKNNENNNHTCIRVDEECKNAAFEWIAREENNDWEEGG